MTFEQFWGEYYSGESHHDDGELMDLLKTVARHSWETANKTSESFLSLNSSEASLTLKAIYSLQQLLRKGGIEAIYDPKEIARLESLYSKLHKKFVYG